MDKVAILFRAVELATRFLPKPKPPTIDYTPLREAIPKLSKAEPPPSTIEEGPPRAETKQDVSTACISCGRSHLSTVSGALGEATRFAREEQGIKHPEVQKRIMMSEDEINILERIDLSPEALMKAPPEERQLAEEYLPRIRKLRQDLGQITSLEDLEKTAAEASILGQEFRLRALQLKGVDLNPVMALAKDVQEGRLTMEAAKEKLKEILPEEE